MKTNYKQTFSILAFCLGSIYSFSQVPVNDNPCITDVNPPFDLTNVLTHDGSTCNATFDLSSLGCNASVDGSSVWYTFEVVDSVDGYDISVQSNGKSLASEGYLGSADQGCTGFSEALFSRCNFTSTIIKISNCGEGDILFVKVSTADSASLCEDFSITINPVQTSFPLSCEEANDLDALQLSVSEFITEPVCVSSSIDYACPLQGTLEGCEAFKTMPTVWYKVEVTNVTEGQLLSYVSTEGNWRPVWSVYGGNGCDSLQIIKGPEESVCSDGDATPDLHQTPLYEGFDYYISISVDPESLPSDGIISDGSFELCVSQLNNVIICLGEDLGDCTDESLVIEVVDRNTPLPIDQDGDGLAGPFCQGEEIEVSISFFYDASETETEWLIGIVPIFGKGWDLTDFDFGSNAPIGNGQPSAWYDEFGPCAPLIQEPNPILCTFVKEDGSLQICNKLCAPCDDCPVSEMSEGDPLPSGYFWVTNGGNEECENDCSPGEGWGIGFSTVEIVWNLKLKVKEFDNYEDFLANNDLSISFQTFSDGSAGCWEDPVAECIIDRAMFGPQWEISPFFNQDSIDFTGFSIDCGVVEFDVINASGSNDTISVFYIDNPQVSGASNYIFEGMGVVNDTLVNNSSAVQIITYGATILKDGFCSPVVYFSVEVEPHSLTGEVIYNCADMSEIQLTFGAEDIGNSVIVYSDCSQDSVLQTIVIEDSILNITIPVPHTDCILVSYLSTEGCLQEIQFPLQNEFTNPQIDTTICEGEAFMGFTVTGTYEVAGIDTISGCNTTTIVNLTVLPSSDPNCSTAVNDSDIQAISIHPNPTSSEVIVGSELPIMRISVYNASAQEMHSESFKGTKATLNLDYYPSGLYLFKIETEKGVFYKKVVKE